MTPQEAVEFIRTHHRAILATTRGDGGVQLSPVMAGVDDDGSVVVSTRETAMKARNLERTPRAAVIVISDGFWGPWVQAEGAVTIEHLPKAMEGLVRYYRSVSGEHPDWDDYRRAMQEERRVLVRLRVERAGPTREG